MAAPLGVPTCARGAAGGQAHRKALGPGLPLGATAGAGGAVHGEHVFRHPEVLFGWETEDLLGGFDFFWRERVAVSLGAVGQVRRRPTDVGAELEETRAVVHGHRPADGVLECLGVVGYLAKVLGMPAVSVEALYGVVVEGDLGGAVDGDVVVVVDVNEPPEPEVPGQGSGFVANAFHQVAVAADHEGVMVHEVRPVLGAEDPFGNAHPYAVGEALPERAGRDLDAFELARLGVARGPRTRAGGTG